MKLSTRARVHVPRSPEQVFDIAVRELPALLQKYGPIPGVDHIEMLEGAQPVTGARRRVTMTDGSVIQEEILELTRPRRHNYRWLNKPKFPFSLIVKTAEADWVFTPESGGTTVEWTYTFTLTTPLVWPQARLAVALFKRWMQKALDRLRDSY